MPTTYRTVIAPSLIASDLGRLPEEIRRIEDAGADTLHLDVMASDFVAAVTFGMSAVTAASQHARLFFEVHLLGRNPIPLIEPLAALGARRIIVRAESEHPTGLGDTLLKIRSVGCDVGISLDPDTRISAVKPYLSRIDLLLLVAADSKPEVQSFPPESLARIEAAHSYRELGPHAYRIGVEGGVTPAKAYEALVAGADTLICGAPLFAASDPGAIIRELRVSPKGCDPRTERPLFS